MSSPLRPIPAANGKKPSYKRGADEFMSFLEYDCNKRGSAIYTSSELQEAFNRSRGELPTLTWDTFVDKLNFEGRLLQQGAGRWKVTTSCVGMHGSQRR